MTPFTFRTSKSIVNQAGAITQLGTYCRELGIQRPFIVTDAGIVKTGLLNQLLEALSKRPCEPAVFAEVIADPPEDVILSGTEQAKDHKADGIIGFGGGSSLDSAKLVALLARSNEKLGDIYGVEQAKGHRLPLILVPTTAGTGSEVTPLAIVTTGSTTKMGVSASQLYPDLALLDAELTLGLPAATTAATGVDAMVHAIEAYTSAIKKNPYSDMLAREALTLMAANIKIATHQGNDLNARQAMLYGACLAGQAFANAPVAAVHALAYPLGGHFHIPHGLSNSLVLPHVLRFNAPAATELYAELADLLIPEEISNCDSRQKTERFVDWLGDLTKALNLPTTLASQNISADDLPMLAHDAMQQQRLLINNPRALTENDARSIYEAAYE